ncbi:MAG: InlB B-repeat-containing protein, partial [Bacteroidaceae bacterium]|nr:InlB B-repeat-containing protein [Bacteroidaceae bacterium]
MKHSNFKSRFVILLLGFLTIGISQAQAKEGDILAEVSGTGSGYGRQTTTDSHNVGWVTIGQSGYFGINKASNNTGAKAGVNATDLPVAKAVDANATSSTSTSSNSCTGYYTFYTTTSLKNVGSIIFYYSANDGNDKATAYVVMGDVKSASGGAAYTQVPLATTSTSQQGVSLGTSGTFTFTFAQTQTNAKFYGVVIKTSSYKRMTNGKITIKEGASSSKTLSSITISGTPTKTTYEAGESFEYAGLTATGKYSDNSEENITNSVEWTCSEEPLQQGTTSVTVTAKQGEVSGNATISSLTVTKPEGDKLTRESTGVSDGTYTTWSNKTGSQGVAKYAGKTAGSYNSIQLNSTSPNGIVSTTSAGLIKKVKVNWNSNTSTSETKKITIYGSNTAYSGSSDLYDNTKQGTSLGEINYNNGGTELEITGEYEYVGIKANKPLYLNSITFVWETALIFNLNGGDGTKPNSITSFPATLPATTSFTKSGYRPNGWNTKADGTGTHYNDGVSFEEPELTTTLYVEWKKVYTMTYNGNSNTEGSVPVDNNSPYDENNSVTVLGNIGNLERTGYTWSGWNTKSDGTGTTYQAESTFDITSNTTLYAKWTANNYMLTFDKNDDNAGGSMAQQEFTFGVAQNLNTNTFTAPEHKYFTGWATSAGGTKTYNDGVSYKMTTEGATIYAVWDWNKTTITLNQQEGSGGTSSVTATYDQAMPTLSTAPSRNGYDFAGYYSEPNGAGTKYYNADKSSAATWLSDDKSATLYAHWTPKTISVTFDENGHGVADGSATIVYNTTEWVTSTFVTASTGYTLNGYYTSSTGGSKVVDVNGALVSGVSNYTDENGKWIQYNNN